MTDRVIRIVVDSDQAERNLDGLEGGLKKVEGQEKRTKQSTQALGQAFRALVGLIAVRELAQAADQYTTIGNRIRLVTDTTAEFNAVQDELIGLAQRTRTDLGATVELYARVARSTEDLGASQREVLEFTEAVNQALQISGATAAEAGAGVIQFAQGLASGALRGDELRSVLEQMPRLASALAKNLGVTIGELRILGQEGKLTAEAVFEAVLKAGPELQEEFEQITPTLSQAMTTIRTFTTVVIGSFNEAAGVTEGLIDIFKLTDDQTTELGATMRELGLDFREFVEVATVSVANFAETVIPTFNAAEAELVKVFAALFGQEALFIDALLRQDKFIAQADDIKRRLQDEFDAIARNNAARRAALTDRDADLDVAREGSGLPGAVAIDKDAERLLKTQQDLLESLLQQEEALAIVSVTGRDYSEVLLELKIQTLAAANANEAFAFDALGAAEEVARLTAEIDANKDAEAARQDQIEQGAQITADARTEQQKFNDEVARLRGFLDDGLISQAVFDASVENLQELDDSLEDFFRRARENSQDILANFFAGGFDSLDDFARAFSEMLLQLTSQALAANVFDSLLGNSGGTDAGGGGGILGALFGGRQFGGGVQGGQAVNTQEGGRFGSEVFIPNVGGTVVPLGADRGGAAALAPPEVNLTLINTIDNSEITGAFNDGAGDQTLLNRFSTRPAAFRRALGV